MDISKYNLELIKKLEERVLKLENLFKCYICNNVDLLFNCYKCNAKICLKCANLRETKSYNEDIVILYFCKECKE